MNNVYRNYYNTHNQYSKAQKSIDNKKILEYEHNIGEHFSSNGKSMRVLEIGSGM